MPKVVAIFTVALLLCAACASAPPPAPEPPREEPRPVEPPPPVLEDPLRIGVIVSSTGSAVLRQYAQLVLEGARVGVANPGITRRDVELVVRDDSGTVSGAVAALRDLERAGVRAIIGPLIDESLAAAARARARDDLVLISPTAVREPAALRNVYALNVVDTRGSAALGEYARRFAHVGVLRARTTEGARQARAFADAYRRAGSGTLTETPFDSGASNVAEQIGRLRDARVQAIYFPGSERELQLILPQIDYFGLTGVELLGNENWVSAAVQSVPQRVRQGATISLSLLRESESVAWSDFVARYEATYRRTLANAIPALGYDAALLAIRAAAGTSLNADAFRGASGVLTLRGDSITRRPFLVRIDGGRLIPVT